MSLKDNRDCHQEMADKLSKAWGRPVTRQEAKNFNYLHMYGGDNSVKEQILTKVKDS